MATAKKLAPIRLGDEGLALLRVLASRKGISQSAVIEIMVRAEAERMGVTAEEAAPARQAPPRREKSFAHV